MSKMQVKRKDEIIIKLSINDAIKIRNEFGKLKGVTDDMKITELIERLDMCGV